MPGKTDGVRAHVWVKGRVQNVGFRAFVEYKAHELGLTGWVRNVSYDTVETVAEGERTRVEMLVEAVKRGPSGARVDESRLEWEEAGGEFKAFEVRRSL